MILKWLWLGKFLQTVKDAKSTEAFPASPRRREMALHLHFPFYDVQVGNFFWKSYHFHFHSIVSLVAVIYCIVIIYLPSLVEADTNFVVNLHLFFLITIEDFFDKCLFLQGPKRCTTTVIERNITNAFQVKSSGDSSYQGSSQPHLTPRVTHSAPGPLAQSGVSVRWRKMILIQFPQTWSFDSSLGWWLAARCTGWSETRESLSVWNRWLWRIFGKKWKCFSAILRKEAASCSTPATTRRIWSLTIARGRNSRSLWVGSGKFYYSAKKDLSSCLRILEILRLVINSATWSPARWLETYFLAFGLSLKIIGDQCLTDGILQKHIEDLGVRLQRQVWIDQRLGNLKSCYNLQPLRLEEEIWWKISSKGTRTVRTWKFWNLWHKQSWVVPSSYMIFMTPFRDGYCNCNRCPESNVTWVMILHFPIKLL